MRKWKCVKADFKKKWIIGKVYTTDDDGYGLVSEDGEIGWTQAQYMTSVKFVEVKDFIKSDLQECDVVVLRNEERAVYFDQHIINKNRDLSIGYYDWDMTITKKQFNKYEIMQVYRNGNLIFKREEQSQRDIKIKELQDKMDAIKREMEELK